jgi:transposase
VSMLSEIVDVVIGVDTHTHTHTAAVVTATGAVLESVTVPADGDGYAALVEFADRHEGLRAWAIESCNGYGAGLTRLLQTCDEWVVEIDRPQRTSRRAGAKSDELDAVRAAREALAREHLAQPRSDGERAVLAVRLTARRSAVDAAADAQRQLHALVVTAPESLRARLRDMSNVELIKTCARLRLDPRSEPTMQHTVTVLRCLARRITALTDEARDHEHAILALVRTWRPDLLKQQGVGPIVAATILCAWSHPGRLRSDAAFAMLAGTAPIPASSGQTVRHRLNRSGDRQLNRAIHTIVITRLRCDPATRAYADRRQAEGKTRREIRRCLKRYITRQIFRQLEHPPLDRT